MRCKKDWCRPSRARLARLALSPASTDLSEENKPQRNKSHRARQPQSASGQLGNNLAVFVFSEGAQRLTAHKALRAADESRLRHRLGVREIADGDGIILARGQIESL